MGPNGAAKRVSGTSDTGALDAIESGIVGLFSSRLIAMVSSWTAFDLVLACVAALTLQTAIERDSPGIRATGALKSVMKGIVLKLVLDSTTTIDLPLYMTHLLCLFLMLHAFDAGGLGSAAKYIFASQIAQAFQADQIVGIAFGATLQVNIGALSATPRLQASPDRPALHARPHAKSRD